jgi:natural product precursor
MKTKAIGRKLVLKKETVARLGDREMSKIYGGATDTCTVGCPPIGTLIACVPTATTQYPTIIT